jgi:hypothetical protein
VHHFGQIGYNHAVVIDLGVLLLPLVLDPSEFLLHLNPALLHALEGHLH